MTALDGVRLVVISDFNAELLGGYLSRAPGRPALEVVTTPFGQVVPTLLDGGAECWQGAPPCCLVWTRPEGVVGGFARLLEGEDVPLASILSEVEAFAQAVGAAAGRARSVLVASWTPPAQARTFGLVDMRPGVGIAGTVARMNLHLQEQLERHGGVLLNAQRWFDGPAKELHNPKRWYLAKIPYGNAVFQAAAADLKAALRGTLGATRKLIVLDLDQTMWGGIVGDDGWEGLRLGGHDPVGEAYVDFQRALKMLARRGFLLAIVSKNDERVALEAIDRHPEMVLRREDFVGWRINWEDKARNVVDLVAQLNLGIDSAVFIDDNPVERARLREAVPEVLVPEWPQDPMLYRSALLGLDCFDVPAFSREDAERTRMYVEDRARQHLRDSVGSIDEWQKSLGTQVTCESVGPGNLPRAAQLLNKTNQLNLRTRRMSEAELAQWAREPNRRLLAFHVADRFGSAGLTALLGLELVGDVAHVVDYVLSCRVMGRKVEETVVHVACAVARRAGMKRVRAVHLPTAKNAPCLAFWRRSGFGNAGNELEFEWNLEREYPLPAGVELIER